MPWLTVFHCHAEMRPMALCLRGVEMKTMTLTALTTDPKAHASETCEFIHAKTQHTYSNKLFQYNYLLH